MGNNRDKDTLLRKGPHGNAGTAAPVDAKLDVSPLRHFRPREREDSIRRKTGGSLERWQRAQRCLAGGVSSGLRRSARRYLLYFSRGQGANIHDVDGNIYMDYALGWGPDILGHASDVIVSAIEKQAARELTFGAQHDLEIEVAEQLVSFIPCADSIRFASSGTEIVLLGLRLARAATGRMEYLKFEGHYHGWDNSVPGKLSSQPVADRGLRRSPQFLWALANGRMMM